MRQDITGPKTHRVSVPVAQLGGHLSSENLSRPAVKAQFEQAFRHFLFVPDWDCQLVSSQWQQSQH